MHEFDSDSTEDDLVFGGGKVPRRRSCRSDAKAGANSFAARADQVRGNVTQELIVGIDRGKKLGFNPTQIG